MDREIWTRLRIEPPKSRPEVSLKNRLRWLLRLRVFLFGEIRPPFHLPLRQRLASWRLGFLTKSYALYDLERNDPRHYLRDGISFPILINDPHYATLTNKLSFSHLMELLGAPHPRVFAFVRERRLHSFDPAEPGVHDAAEVLPRLLERHGRLVVKPCHRGEGQGVMILEAAAGKLRVNGIDAALDDVLAVIERLEHTYVSEFIVQHEYARALFPGTSNTVRVLTIWDDERQEPFIAAAAQRIGSSRSFPVDNFHQGRGGLSANIDLDSGRLSQALTLTGREGRIARHSHHPESGAAIEGVVVPYWREIRELLLRTASRLPQNPLVGWDLLVTADGCSILEANCPPGFAVWQAHVPLLVDPRSRRFFTRIGLA